MLKKNIYNHVWVCSIPDVELNLTVKQILAEYGIYISG